MATHIPNLSTVKDVFDIRVKDCLHAIDIICQVKKFSPPSNVYKFLTCEVVDNEFPELRKSFSFKVWSHHFAQISGVREGDIVCIKRGLRKEKDRRTSNGYVLQAKDMNFEMHSWKKSSVEILFSGAVEDIRNFNLITVPLKEATVYGHVDRLPQKDGNVFLMTLADEADNLLSVELSLLLDMKLGDKCFAIGSLTLSDDVFTLHASHFEIVPPASSLLLSETSAKEKEAK